MTSAPIKRLILGQELRKLREAAGMTHLQAADAIGGSASKVSRLEGGRFAVPKRADVDTLAVLYGAKGPVREHLLQLLFEASEPAWWQPYSGQLPSWFSHFLGLEQGARTIRAYETSFMPGLLQTPGYRTLITDYGQEGDDVSVHLWSDLRKRRQQIVTSGKTHFHAIISENCFRLDIGDQRVMNGQVEHLIKLSGKKNVTIQVMPPIMEVWAAHANAFEVLDFAGLLPSVAYFETLHEGHLVEEESKVSDYESIFFDLEKAALNQADSVQWMSEYLSRS